MRPGAFLMHPGPMNHGVEFAVSAAELAAQGVTNLITTQVTNGIAVRMSVLFSLFSIDSPEAAHD
jgi:aspartate carbamoyltransferase catalytic subunit